MGSCRNEVEYKQGIGRAANKDDDPSSFPASHGSFERETQMATSKERSRKYYEAHKEIIKQRAKLWHEANPEKAAITEAKYRERNREIIAEKRRARVAANPEKVAAYNAKHKANNPHSKRIHSQNRRNLTVGKLSRGIADKLFDLQKGKCPICKVSLKGIKTHIDHVIPISLGGPNVDSNVQLLCVTCNLQKHARHPVEFMQSKGFLL